MAGELPTEGCEGHQIVAPGVPCATNNLCVLGIDERIWRITQELTKNVSARVTAFSADDKERIDSYYASLLSFADNAGSDFLDLHYLAEFTLTDIVGAQVPVENEAINAAVQYLLGADINLRISQSSRINDGILPTDLDDFKTAVEKSKRMVDNAYDNFNPMDMPQSNPRRQVVNPTR